VINRARPITDFAETAYAEDLSAPERKLQGTLYIKLPSEESPLFAKLKAILAMFPGDTSVVVYFADTKRRRGSRCALDERMLGELKNLLGTENVVVK